MTSTTSEQTGRPSKNQSPDPGSISALYKHPDLTMLTPPATYWATEGIKSTIMSQILFWPVGFKKLSFIAQCKQVTADSPGLAVI